MNLWRIMTRTVNRSLDYGLLTTGEGEQEH